MTDDCFPDIYGLPIFRVSRTIKQRHGDELHILKGFEVFGQVQWSHVEIWKISELAAGIADLQAAMVGPPLNGVLLRKAH